MRERAVVTTFGSVCSGIESVSVAVDPLGWKPAWFSEIEPFPSAVLEHRFPDVQNHGDMTQLPARVLRGEIEAPEVLVGGTPCQAFSVAGMRQGIADPRGALTIKFVELADAIDHVRSADGREECVVWWENVPGVLSDKGNAFGCFLAALVGESDPLEPPGTRWTDAGCVYGPQRTAAWRVLDAQYFGLAQRRRRVFVVASARRGFDPASVLFESEGVRRDTPPSREAGEGITHDLAPCLTSSGRGVERTGDTRGQDPVVAVSVALRGRDGGATAELGGDVAGTLRASSGGGDKPYVLCMAHGQGGAEIADNRSPTLTCNHEAPIVVHGTQDPDIRIDQAHTLGRNHGQENAVCVTGDITHTLKAEGFDGSEDGTGRGQPIVNWANEVCPTLRAGGNSTGGDRPPGTDVDTADSNIVQGSAIRRLTPRECERLQGFPDDWTKIPWRGKPADECPDGPRYKAIGNSKAVPVVRWIARRIESEL